MSSDVQMSSEDGVSPVTTVSEPQLKRVSYAEAAEVLAFCS